MSTGVYRNSTGVNRGSNLSLYPMSTTFNRDLCLGQPASTGEYSYIALFSPIRFDIFLPGIDTVERGRAWFSRAQPRSTGPYRIYAYLNGTVDVGVWGLGGRAGIYILMHLKLLFWLLCLIWLTIASLWLILRSLLCDDMDDIIVSYVCSILNTS